MSLYLPDVPVNEDNAELAPGINQYSYVSLSHRHILGRSPLALDGIGLFHPEVDSRHQVYMCEKVWNTPYMSQ